MQDVWSNCLDSYQSFILGIPKNRRNALPNPLTMKAALLKEYGKLLEIAEVPRPVPNADEVLVKIEASGVCSPMFTS